MQSIAERIREAVRQLAEEKDRIIVAIDGSCASGKSTLGAMLTRQTDWDLFRMDDFFLRPEQRTPQRLAQPGGNVDYERVLAEVLIPLRKGEPFCYQPYDCSTGCLKSAVAVTPKKVSIVEGSYSHHPAFGEIYDLKVFLQVSPQVRAERILARPEWLQKRFFAEWIPMEQQYFEAYDIAGKADIIAMPRDNR